eukprot:1495063-Pleurochrysis_carterae.AAC.4
MSSESGSRRPAQRGRPAATETYKPAHEYGETYARGRCAEECAATLDKASAHMSSWTGRQLNSPAGHCDCDHTEFMFSARRARTRCLKQAEWRRPHREAEGEVAAAWPRALCVDAEGVRVGAVEAGGGRLAVAPRGPGGVVLRHDLAERRWDLAHGRAHDPAIVEHISHTRSAMPTPARACD